MKTFAFCVFVRSIKYPQVGAGYYTNSVSCNDGSINFVDSFGFERSVDAGRVSIECGIFTK